MSIINSSRSDSQEFCPYCALVTWHPLIQVFSKDNGEWLGEALFCSGCQLDEKELRERECER